MPGNAGLQHKFQIYLPLQASDFGDGGTAHKSPWHSRRAGGHRVVVGSRMVAAGAGRKNVRSRS
ncbi:MAG: hypothetical protein ACK4QP_14550 [Pseudorhizobium sp.]